MISKVLNQSRYWAVLSYDRCELVTAIPLQGVGGNSVRYGQDHDRFASDRSPASSASLSVELYSDQLMQATDCISVDWTEWTLHM